MLLIQAGIQKMRVTAAFRKINCHVPHTIITAANGAANVFNGFVPKFHAFSKRGENSLISKNIEY